MKTDLNNMSSVMQEAIERMAKAIQDKKDILILQRTKQLGIAIDINDVNTPTKNRPRFNPFIREVHEGFGESYYYNDGSFNGKFIIGFVQKPYKPRTLKELASTTLDLREFEFEVIIEEPEWNKRIKL